MTMMMYHLILHEDFIIIYLFMTFITLFIKDYYKSTLKKSHLSHPFSSGAQLYTIASAFHLVEINILILDSTDI